MRKSARGWTNTTNLNKPAPAWNPVKGDLYIAPSCVFPFVLQRHGGDNHQHHAGRPTAAAPL
jgi:hypothetical protein